MKSKNRLKAKKYFKELREAKLDELRKNKQEQASTENKSELQDVKNSVEAQVETNKVSISPKEIQELQASTENKSELQDVKNAPNEDNEVFKDFQENNKDEYNKQNKLINKIDDKLDKFEQKLFHSQGGEKTALPGFVKNGLSYIKSKFSRENTEEDYGGGSSGGAEILGFIAAAAAQTAVSYGHDKFSNFFQDEENKENVEIESELHKNNQIEGQISKEASNLNPKDIEALEKQDVKEIKTQDGMPFYLKENPNKTINPFSKEKAYRTSDYVENLMKSQKSLEEKMSILSELKKRKDINSEDVKKLEEHVRVMKENKVSYKDASVSNVPNVDLNLNSFNNNNIENNVEKKENKILKETKLDKKVSEAESQVKIVEKLREKSIKEAQEIGNSQLDNTHKDNKPVIDGSVSNIYNSIETLVRGNDGKDGKSGTNGTDGRDGINGSNGISASTSSANLPSSPAGTDTVSQSTAMSEDNSSQAPSVSTNAASVSSNPISTPNLKTSEASVSNNPTPNIGLNGASKQLAKDTIGTEPKPDTITNESVINNQVIEKIPQSPWDKFNDADLDVSQDSFLRGL